MDEKSIEELREDFEREWPVTIAREEVEKYTGGLVAATSMAMYDSLGTGVKDPITMGRKVAYRKKNLIDWIINNINKKNLKKGE